MNDDIYYRDLKRDRDTILKKLIHKNGVLTPTEDMVIVFPERFIAKKLCLILTNVNVVMFFAIIDSSGNYAIFNGLGFMELTPYKSSFVKIDEKEYMELKFRKGEVLSPNTTVVKKATTVYNVFSEFYVNGNIPWYANYEDVSDIFKYSQKYAGTHIGNDPLGYEILTAIIARNPENTQDMYREAINSRADAKKIEPMFTGLEDPYNTFKSTFSKIGGSYLSQGIVSAIVNDEMEKTPLEKVILK